MHKEPLPETLHCLLEDVLVDNWVHEDLPRLGSN